MGFGLDYDEGCMGFVRSHRIIVDAALVIHVWEPGMFGHVGVIPVFRAPGASAPRTLAGL